MNRIFAVAALIVAGYIVFQLVRNYLAETEGTAWDKLSSAFNKSATILVAQLTALAGAGMAGLDGLGDLIGMPGVSDQIRGLLDAKYVPYYLLAVAILTNLARRRTL